MFVYVNSSETAIISLALSKTIISGWIFVLAYIFALSDTINGAVMSLLIVTLIAFLASIKKLVLLLIRFGEAWGTMKIKNWCKKNGINPKDVLNDD